MNLRTSYRSEERPTLTWTYTVTQSATLARSLRSRGYLFCKRCLVFFLHIVQPSQVGLH